MGTKQKFKLRHFHCDTKRLAIISVTELHRAVPARFMRSPED
jgi:hypothetical protein